MVMKAARALTKSVARGATRTAAGITAGITAGVATDIATDIATDSATDSAGKMMSGMTARYPANDAQLKVEVRKIAIMIEEINHEGGPVAKRAVKKGAIAAVVHNPFAGRYVKDVQPLMDLLKPLGLKLADRLIKALGGPKKIEGYGKAIIVGVNGESEHAALWHVPGGYGMRELLENAKAIVPSTIKVAPAGTVIDVPIHHRTAAYVRSHFDSVEVRVADAPRPDEIVFILAMTCGGRVHERMGGMKMSEIVKFDGQR